MLGFVNICKPPGITAHDVVAFVRKTTGVRQVGHGGTLDPLASGVLPVAIGKACRLLRFLPSIKVYLAEILLGVTTKSDDVTGEIVSTSVCKKSDDDILQAISSFRGKQEQIPPIYSAVHIEGKRLYQLARQDKQPAIIPARTVYIEDIEVVELISPKLLVRIKCSAGTYIRSIARDLGKKLGCGACLKSLIREVAGPFHIKDAYSLEEFREKWRTKQTSKPMIAPQNVLELGLVNIDSYQAQLLSYGKAIAVPSCSLATPKQWAQENVLALLAGSVYAVCKFVDNTSSLSAAVTIQPEVVIGYGE